MKFDIFCEIQRAFPWNAGQDEASLFREILEQDTLLGRRLGALPQDVVREGRRGQQQKRAAKRARTKKGFHVTAPFHDG